MSNKYTDAALACREAGVTLWYAICFSGFLIEAPFAGGPEDWWAVDQDREMQLWILLEMDLSGYKVGPYKIRYQRALEKFVDLNMGLVYTMMHRWKKAATKVGLEESDLVQSGVIGLFRALQKFDVGKGFQFSTYAQSWIFQAMSRAIFTYSTVHTPVVRSTQSPELKAKARLARVARSLDHPAVGSNAMVRTMANGGHTSSAGHFDAGQDAQTGLELFSDSRFLPADQVSQVRQDQENLRKAMRRLNPVEARVLDLRFDAELGLEEIGKMLTSPTKPDGVTRERVRQIEQRALQKLRKFLDKDDVNMLELIDE